jgi:pyruvate/2-oxoglutarate/acetoin dehydrogenase E1 component
MSTMTLRESIRDGMRQALTEDDRVFLMGEDVGSYGGAFAVSGKLLEEFGPERIRDAPLAESAFMGAGIGAAINGMRPIVEIMTINFSMLAMDQVLNTAATLRYMSGGQFSIPLVVRMATGGGRQMGAQHAHSLENWYAYIPGIKCLSPATVADGRAMVLAAVADPDPVFIFENAILYGNKGETEDEDWPDVWKAAVRREGKDVTVVSYSASVFKALEAAELLAAEGIELEVIDLRALRPLDMDTVLASLAKTNRALIVDEGWRTGSIAAEVSAQIMERGFDLLDWPVLRVCSAEIPMPYAKHLEDAALPNVERIVAAVHEMEV